MSYGAQRQYSAPAPEQGLRASPRGNPSRGNQEKNPKIEQNDTLYPNIGSRAEKQPLFQQQPVPSRMPQSNLPGPAPALRPGNGPYARGLAPDAPFAAMDTIHGPGRDSERILQQQSATYLNSYLAQKTPVQIVNVLQYAHKIEAPIYEDIPQVPYPTGRVPFLSGNAYTDLRAEISASAPVQLQNSPGGLIVAGYQNIMQNINTALAGMYSGASAPVSSNYSGACK